MQTEGNLETSSLFIYNSYTNQLKTTLLMYIQIFNQATNFLARLYAYNCLRKHKKNLMYATNNS